jgi:hypothetical protein
MEESDKNSILRDLESLQTLTLSNVQHGSKQISQGEWTYILHQLK